MQFTEKLKIELAKVIGVDDIKLERPADRAHGDWSTNVALTSAKKLQKNPREIAAQIKTALENSAELSDVLAEVEVAGPGFINFKLKPEYFYNFLANWEENYAEIVKAEKPMRIIVEMGDPNTHKFPHIGHLFNYIVGDSVARIMAESGHKILKATWQGDVGMQVAKCLYGWQQQGKPTSEDLLERMQILQDAYVLGSSLFDESEEHKAKIQDINKKVYEHDPEVYADWKLTRDWSLEFDEYFEAKLGIKIANRYLEGDLWKQGVEIVKQNIGTVFVESDGAIVFPGEKYGLHTRVFLTQKGTPTYEAKEIGLNTQKMKDFPYDLTIIPTASEQNAYFDVVFTAIEQAVPELKGKLVHIGTGMISLTTGKMSSRKGNILTGPGLVESVEQKVAEKVSEREELNDANKEVTIGKISIGAIKYAFLKSNILQNMVFDLEESIAFDGNSGPYLQYTYARIKSVLRQGDETGEVQEVLREKSSVTAEVLASLESAEEVAVIRWLERFPETIILARDNYAPHHISHYIFELAQLFNTFYKTSSINSAETTELKDARRILAAKVAETIQKGLNLLGIETLEKM